MNYSKREHTVIDIETGKLHKFSNISEFARKHGLYHSGVSSLVNGRGKKGKVCGKFKLAGEPQTLEMIEYSLISPRGRLVKTHNIQKLCHDHKINRRKLHLVIDGELNNVDGWRKAGDEHKNNKEIKRIKADLSNQLLKTVLFA